MIINTRVTWLESNSEKLTNTSTLPERHERAESASNEATPLSNWELFLQLQATIFTRNSEKDIAIRIWTHFDFLFHTILQDVLKDFYRSIFFHDEWQYNKTSLTSCSQKNDFELSGIWVHRPNLIKRYYWRIRIYLLWGKTCFTCKQSSKWRNFTIISQMLHWQTVIWG